MSWQYFLIINLCLLIQFCILRSLKALERCFFSPKKTNFTLANKWYRRDFCSSFKVCRCGSSISESVKAEIIWRLYWKSGAFSRFLLLLIPEFWFLSLQYKVAEEIPSQHSTTKFFSIALRCFTFHPHIYTWTWQAHEGKLFAWLWTQISLGSWTFSPWHSCISVPNFNFCLLFLYKTVVSKPEICAVRLFIINKTTNLPEGKCEEK